MNKRTPVILEQMIAFFTIAGEHHGVKVSSSKMLEQTRA
jgi:hypothetical protein